MTTKRPSTRREIALTIRPPLDTQLMLHISRKRGLRRFHVVTTIRGLLSVAFKIPSRPLPPPPPPPRPLEESSSGTFNISVMFYRSVVLDYGIDENLNICIEPPAVPPSFTDVSRDQQGILNAIANRQIGPELRACEGQQFRQNSLF